LQSRAQSRTRSSYAETQQRLEETPHKLRSVGSTKTPLLSVPEGRDNEKGWKKQSYFILELKQSEIITLQSRAQSRTRSSYAETQQRLEETTKRLIGLSATSLKKKVIFEPYEQQNNQ
jgi:hypothetical protein